MISPFTSFWRHVNECVVCAAVERFLCPTGEAMLQQANERAASLEAERANVEQLAACRNYARVVSEVLPINEEAERMVSALIRKRSEGYVSRKLERRKP